MLNILALFSISLKIGDYNNLEIIKYMYWESYIKTFFLLYDL